MFEKYGCLYINFLGKIIKIQWVKKKKKNKDRVCGEEIFFKEWKDIEEGNGLILIIYI